LRSSRIARSTGVSGSGAEAVEQPSRVGMAKSSRRSHASRTTDARRGCNLAGRRAVPEGFDRLPAYFPQKVRMAVCSAFTLG
jgi:hypothetical protein